MQYVHKNGIGLKKVERADLKILLELKQESWFGTHKVAILNTQDQERWFENQASDSLALMAFDMNKKRAKVGVYKIAGIDWINGSASEGHDIFLKYRGQGYSHKVLECGIDFCFEVLNLRRLDAEVLENNRASQKSVDRVGYTREGTRRKAVHRCGQWLDSFIYGMLREDWQQLGRVKAMGGICNVSYQPKDGL